MKIKTILPLLMSTLVLFGCTGNSTPSLNVSDIPSASVDDSTSSSVEDPSVSVPPLTVMSVAEARAASKDTQIAVQGIVTAFNYSGQQTPFIAGFWVSDETDTIYIYSEAVAKTVEVGNKIRVQGTKTYYIPEKDVEAAITLSYAGMSQMTNPVIISNDGKKNEIPAEVINLSTVKEIGLTPLSTDISGKIYKVKGYWHKYQETGYTNYGINDLNRLNSLNAYTQSNGKDYKWTDDFDNKSVEMLIITTLAKPLTAEWKFCPIKVINEITVTNEEEADYGVYRALLEINDVYKVDTTITVLKEDEKVPGLTRIYSSKSSQVVVDTTGIQNEIRINTSPSGELSIKVTVSYNGVQKEGSKTFNVEGKPVFVTKTIAEAKALADDTEVTVEAVVATITYKAGLTKQGMFLADETGSLFVFNGTETMANLNPIEKGNKVVVTGKMAHFIKNADYAAAEGYSGDIQLTNVTVKFIDSNIYSIPNEVIINSSIAEIIAHTPSQNITSLIYKVNAVVKKGSYGSYSLLDADDATKSLPLYTQASGADFTFLESYTDKTVTIIVGIQNLNLRAANSNWRGCPIQVLGEVA